LYYENSPPVKSLSGSTLQAELRRVRRLYDAAILADDLERAAEHQAHYHALVALRQAELLAQVRILRLAEIEASMAQSDAVAEDFERRLSELEAAHYG
jgi:hypothetical protein